MTTDTTEAAPANSTEPEETEAPETEAAEGTKTEAQAGAGAPETEPAEEPQKYALKWGKESREVDLAELQQLAQKAYGIERKAEETAKERKSFEQATQRIKSMLGDPDGIFDLMVRARNGDARAAEDVILDMATRIIEWQQLPEDERRRRVEHRELKTKAQRLEEIERERTQQSEQAQVQQMAQRFEADCKRSLEGVGIEPDGYAIELWRIVQQDALDRTGEMLTPEEAAARVAKKSGAVRKAEAERVKADQLARAKAKAEKAPAPRAPTGQFAPVEKKTTSEWLKEKVTGGKLRRWSHL